MNRWRQWRKVRYLARWPSRELQPRDRALGVSRAARAPASGWRTGKPKGVSCGQRRLRRRRPSSVSVSWTFQLRQNPGRAESDQRAACPGGCRCRSVRTDCAPDCARDAGSGSLTQVNSLLRSVPPPACSRRSRGIAGRYACCQGSRRVETPRQPRLDFGRLPHLSPALAESAVRSSLAHGPSWSGRAPRESRAPRRPRVGGSVEGKRHGEGGLGQRSTSDALGGPARTPLGSIGWLARVGRRVNPRPLPSSRSVLIPWSPMCDGMRHYDRRCERHPRPV
jgi:hypothetical protein